jgi:para-nitrobenzyl esterase
VGAIYGAFHGLELPFVFDDLAIFAGAYTPTTADQDLVTGLQGYWGRFAATRDPNGSGAVVWPRYDANADPYLALDTAVSANSALLASQCDFIDALRLEPPRFARFSPSVRQAIDIHRAFHFMVRERQRDRRMA